MLIYPYNAGSASVKALAKALGLKRIKREGSKLKGRPNKVVINWGNSSLPEEVAKCTVVNAPTSVAKASNKLSFFKAMREAGVRIPRFTEALLEATQMIEEGKMVVCRTILNGHSGAGIVLAEKFEGLVPAPLYVEYVPKKQEYRVHIFRGEVVDVQRKARNKGVPDEKVNWRIRNHANGFIFARGEDVLGDVPKDVLEQAKQAVDAIGLDFGAVDIIFNEKLGEAFVLEVNTAPGLSGSTLDGYVERFRGLANGHL